MLTKGNSSGGQEIAPMFKILELGCVNIFGGSWVPRRANSWTTGTLMVRGVPSWAVMVTSWLHTSIFMGMFGIKKSKVCIEYKSPYD